MALVKPSPKTEVKAPVKPAKPSAAKAHKPPVKIKASTAAIKTVKPKEPSVIISAVPVVLGHVADNIHPLVAAKESSVPPWEDLPVETPIETKPKTISMKQVLRMVGYEI